MAVDKKVLWKSYRGIPWRRDTAVAAEPSRESRCTATFFGFDPDFSASFNCSRLRRCPAFDMRPVIPGIYVPLPTFFQDDEELGQSIRVTLHWEHSSIFKQISSATRNMYNVLAFSRCSGATISNVSFSHGESRCPSCGVWLHGRSRSSRAYL